MVSDVRRALRLRGSARGADVLGLRMFENTPVAMLITRRRVIERGNAAATALLEDCRPLSVVGGKLRFEDSRAQAGFEAISKSDAGRNGQALAFIVEGAGGRTWIAQLSPLKQAGVQDGSWVVVALSPFTGASQTRETLLNGFTELTPTERAIFASFVDGEDIAAIAAKMSRSVETVRWHVRNLFTKLGVNSQADLARRGALLLPI
jgi:DNA-binding CsgD family transcriptional regulator